MITKSQVKYIQSLGHKKFRDEEGVFVVEGPKIVGELLQAPGMRLRQLYALKEWTGAVSNHLPGSPRPTSATAYPSAVGVSASELERLSGLSTPNQVLAVFEKPSFPPPDFGAGLSLVLDGIQDPGNLGTIVRIADWFGIQRVLCTADSADVFNAKAVQSTMGSISRVPVVYANPEDILLRYPGLPVYAAVLEGKELYKTERISRGWIVIGNESKGIRPALLEQATNRITIPRVGQAESLNAAVATGIILSHLAV
ncbi:MAG TPA: RNA methyltransferase [Puia sp.]|jgi:TrmH family RNA methyltransferase